MRDFDAKAVKKELKQITKLRKPKRYSRSKLDEWRYELPALRAEGVTLKELQYWLKHKNNVDCALSTISRWFHQHA